MDANYYREKLNECHREADAATDANDKVAWREMASTWLELLSQAHQDEPVSASSVVEVAGNHTDSLSSESSRLDARLAHSRVFLSGRVRTPA
jgi:hypothetical protein